MVLVSAIKQLRPRDGKASKKTRVLLYMLLHALLLGSLAASLAWQQRAATGGGSHTAPRRGVLAGKPNHHPKARAQGRAVKKGQQPSLRADGGDPAAAAAEAEQLRVMQEAVLGYSIFGSQTDEFPWFKAQQVCPLLEGRQVAFVGNGPLDDRQRRRINASQVVLRFNALNNWQPGDRTDLWVIRYQPDADSVLGFSIPAFQWARVPGCLQRVMAVGSEARQLWLVMLAGFRQELGPRLDRLVQYFNTSEADPRIMRPWGVGFSVAYQAAVRQYMGDEELVAMPTTGLIGLLAALECKPARVDIYGSNWSDTWGRHQMGIEEGLVRELARRGSVKVFPTPCKGRRFCGPRRPSNVGICDIGY